MGRIRDVTVLLRPGDVSPRADGHCVKGVLNPAVAQVDDCTRLLARVIEGHELNKPYEEYVREGAPAPDYVYLPRAHNHGVHWEKKKLGAEVVANDAFSVTLPGLVAVVRPTVISHARIIDLARDEPCGEPRVKEVSSKGFFPATPYEEFGIEDPRVTPLASPFESDGKQYQYLVSYVACSDTWGVATAFALSNDLKTFDRFPPRDPTVVFHPPLKDVVLFTQKLDGPGCVGKHYWAIIRPGAAHSYISPSMFLLASRDLQHWGHPYPFIPGTTEGHVGAGVPPIRTDHGWLIIYHGRTVRKGTPHYEGWAAFVDYEKPWSSIRRCREPILVPFDTGEENVIADVAFPTGALLLDDGTLEIYLGVNDSVVAVARTPLENLFCGLSD